MYMNQVTCSGNHIRQLMISMSFMWSSIGTRTKPTVSSVIFSAYIRCRKSVAAVPLSRVSVPPLLPSFPLSTGPLKASRLSHAQYQRCHQSLSERFRLHYVHTVLEYRLKIMTNIFVRTNVPTVTQENMSARGECTKISEEH